MIKKEIKKMFSLKLLALQHLTDLQHSLIWNFPSIPFTILPWFPLSAWTSSVFSKAFLSFAGLLKSDALQKSIPVTLYPLDDFICVHSFIIT